MAFRRSPVRSRSGPPSFARPSGELRMASQRATFHQRRMSTIAAQRELRRDGGPRKPRRPSTDGGARNLRALGTRTVLNRAYSGATPREILHKPVRTQTCRHAAGCGCRSVASTYSGVKLIPRGITRASPVIGAPGSRRTMPAAASTQRVGGPGRSMSSCSSPTSEERSRSSGT